MADINDLLKASYKTLNELQNKLGELDKVHQDILDLKDAAIKGKEGCDKIPQEFERLFNEIKSLSEKYLKDIGVATKTYFDGNNKIYEKNQDSFKKQIEELNTKNKDLQSKIGQLENQIKRLSEIDLEGGFRQLQETLAKIFKSINDINLTLTSITQTLNSIVQSLGAIQTAIDTNHKETKQLVNDFSEATSKHLADQDTEAKKNSELLENKIKSLAEQNDLLKQEAKTNRIIQIIGLTIILIILIYVAVK